jgi:hypothetical protein
MQFDCNCGDTAFILDAGGGHKYIVLTNPNGDDNVVIVNITTFTGLHKDGKVFSRNDDKDLFPKRSIISYRRAKIYPAETLRAEANRKDVVNFYKKCPSDIMKRIIKDAFKSQFIKEEVIEELKISYPDEYEKYYDENN